MPDDFCLEHGYEYMVHEKTWGAIPYCGKCKEEESGPAEAIEAIRRDLKKIMEG